MRSLTRPTDDDRGAVLVWVALMIVVLLGVGALVIDVGALYAERRQLQNGADAAALGRRHGLRRGRLPERDGHCRRRTPTRTPTTAPPSRRGVRLRARPADRARRRRPAPPARPAGCRSTTSTHNPANADDHAGQLPASRRSSTRQRRRHRARLGGRRLGRRSAGRRPSRSPSRCASSRRSAARSTARRSRPATGYIYFHGEASDRPADCPSNPSGQNLPGGFGWLDSTQDCEAAVDRRRTGSAATPGTACRVTAIPQTGREQTKVAHPALRRRSADSGSNGEYHIVGFAGFKMLGYKFGMRAMTWNCPATAQCPATCTGNSGRCLYGEFTHVTTTDGEIGGGTDFGATRHPNDRLSAGLHSQEGTSQ